MAIQTRLSNLGLIGQPYPGFIAKAAAGSGPHNPGTITRLTQIGLIGGAVSFSAKSGAAPATGTTRRLQMKIARGIGL